MAMLSAFELFGLPEKFAIDLEALEKAHERAILKVHPDRFAGRPGAALLNSGAPASTSPLMF